MIPLPKGSIRKNIPHHRAFLLQCRNLGVYKVLETEYISYKFSLECPKGFEYVQSGFEIPNNLNSFLPDESLLGTTT